MQHNYLNLVEIKTIRSFNFLRRDINNLKEKISLAERNLTEKMLELKKIEERIKKLSKERNQKKKLKFFDLKRKRSFSTNKYSYKIRAGRKFAVAKAPSGVKSWRILGSR